MSWLGDLRDRTNKKAKDIFGGIPGAEKAIDTHSAIAFNPLSFQTGGLLGGDGGVINWGEKGGTGEYGASTTNSLRGDSRGGRQNQRIGAVIGSMFLGSGNSGSSTAASQSADAAAAVQDAEAVAKAQAAAQAAADSSQSAGLLGYGSPGYTDSMANGGAGLGGGGLTGKDIMGGLKSVSEAAASAQQINGLLTPKEIVPAQMRQGDPAGPQTVAQLYQSSQQATQDQINQAMQARMQRRSQW